MNKTKTENCMVCGNGLIYSDKSETLRCVYCKTVEDGHIHCPEGHYICDRCHNREAMAGIEETILRSESQDPFEIAELAMSLPGLTMLGCQHAYIAGGALMAAIRNRGKNGVGDPEIREVFKRTRKQAHGGYCGLTGVCGIAPAIGACFAVLTGSKCGKDKEQWITMDAVTKVSGAITALTGPSCCKAYVRTSLSAAVDALREHLGIDLPGGGNVTCLYSGRHPHGCREKMCPYFGAHPDHKGGAKVEHQEEKPIDVGTDFTTADSAQPQEVHLETLMRRALELGAEKAKVIRTESIVVREWVRWKCLYGCALYGKDGYHPPCAPDASSTKKVLREYSRAILMTGPKGKPLTEAAVRLEGEAYRLGFYKAFGLTALSSGPAGET